VTGARPAAAAPAEWRVHVGAHKTATTHFQALLADAAPLVRENGGAVLLADALRAQARAVRDDTPGLRGLRYRLRTRLQAPARLRASAGACSFVVASEEALIGSVPQVLHSDFYPDLRGIDLVRRAARGARLELFVSIRSYDTLLSSTLFEMLKVFPDAKERWEAGMDRVLARCTGWPGLMARLERRVPDARLGFWCQESYTSDPAAVLRQFTGCDLPDLPPVPPPARTRAPALSALEEIATLDPGLQNAERAARVRAIYERHPAGPEDGSPASVLLAPADRARLAQRYVDDLAVLRGRYRELGPR
jgi:hypothetical protein